MFMALGLLPILFKFIGLPYLLQRKGGWISLSYSYRAALRPQGHEYNRCSAVMVNKRYDSEVDVVLTPSAMYADLPEMPERYKPVYIPFLHFVRVDGVKRGYKPEHIVLMVMHEKQEHYFILPPESEKFLPKHLLKITHH